VFDSSKHLSFESLWNSLFSSLSSTHIIIIKGTDNAESLLQIFLDISSLKHYSIPRQCKIFSFFPLFLFLVASLYSLAMSIKRPNSQVSPPTYPGEVDKAIHTHGWRKWSDKVCGRILPVKDAGSILTKELLL
jgi:hypothetical protein